MAQPFYVTTPIYYVNDAPHIGHAYSTVTSDALARWRRLWGDDVVFLTGTDEHGLKVQRAAEAQGKTPKAFVDETSERYREAWTNLDISNTEFIRTTDPGHYAAVQEFAQAIYDAGYIELGTYEGLYCVSCEAYYTEDELVDGLCPIHHSPVERVSEENYFFQLSRFEDRLLAYYADHPDAVQPESRRNEVLGFIRQGLRDFSVSRTSISWGVPLPWDPEHVAYVWFDALFNYCTAVGYGADRARFDRYWPADYHIVGKDILRFHAVYWPAMLMAVDEAPPKHVFAHGFLLVGGEKMSKTAFNQISPNDLVADFGADGVRYHFLADLRFGADGDFSYEGMVARYNADLANNFGNLASRVLNMATSYCDAVAPAARAEGPLVAATARAFEEVTNHLERLEYSAAYFHLWELIRAANSYIEDQEPWKLHKAGETDAVAGILGDCLETLRVVAVLASPAIPNACRELWGRLGLEGAPEDQRLPDAAQWSGAPAGTPLVKGDALFPRKDSE
jgi:methionyl-tRNA synthetase